jgi:phosphoglycolate phosphatase
VSNFENIIFDFDGTLVDTQSDIKESFIEATYEIKGVTINASYIRIGPPLEEMIRKLFTDISSEEVKKIVTSFRTRYANCGFNHTICYNGIEKLLKTLNQQGKHIYIATNKPGYLTKAIIDKLNIHYFDDIFAIDSIEGYLLSKKEMISLLVEKNKLERRLTLMVGDSASDIKSARENALTSVGVGYGYETKEQILMANPDFYIDSEVQLTVFLSK